MTSIRRLLLILMAAAAGSGTGAIAKISIASTCTTWPPTLPSMMLVPSFAGSP
jgi:hypothetical protein